jgi:transporter family protein
MRLYIIYAIIAGIAWGVGGYFEKAGLQEMKIPPIAGITLRTCIALLILGVLSIPAWRGIADPANTQAWLKIIIGGGIIAGSLGMWSFYSALSISENLGVTLAIAFAFAPLSGTVLGLLRGVQKIDIKIAVGLTAIIIGIIFLQLSHKSAT